MKWKVLLALASMALPMAANALGLGEIKLNSALNDKFNADIPVVGATSDELDSLEVKLAGMSQFTQAGLDRPDVLNQLQFVVVRNPDGTSFVHITSNAAVREPFLDFLVDADWNNGELIREYTVLLNPPAFQTANAAPAAAAPAPAAAAQTPAASTAAPVAVAPVPVPVPVPSAATQPAAAPTPTETPAAQAPAEVAAAPQPAPSAVSTSAPATPPPAAPAPSVEQAPAQRALGTNYGPIHRGETLSSIAKSVRPEGVTLNQMMIAIYQANPEVFMHNINRMKTGRIMRMPTASDAQAVSVTDANAEVREQMQAWRSGHIETTPPASTAAAAAPALQLVAPGSSESTTNTQTPGAETNGSGETPAAPAPVVEKPAEKPAPTKSSNLPPPAPAAQPVNQAPLSVQSNAGANVQAQAAKQNANPAPSLPPPAATNVPLSKPKSAPKQFTQPAESGGIMDMLFGLPGIILLLVILAIVAAVIVIKKHKAKGGSGATSSGARIKADWMKQESVDSGDNTAASSTTRTRSRQKKAASAEDIQDRTVLSEPPTEVAGGGDSDKTMLMAAPPPAPMQETVVSGGSQLDVSDPMAEADFHMAYGLYDQAADVLKKALRQNPDSRPLQVKLLEVFFTAGDRNNFVNEAKKLRQSMGNSPDKDWESVAIMGRQVAPDEALFSASGASLSTGAVDIALDGGGTDTVVSDLDALEGAFTSAGATPAPEAPAPAPAPVVEDNSLEFSLPDLEPMGSPEVPVEAPAPAAGGDFDLGDLNFEPTPSAKPAEKKSEPTLGTDEPTVATDFGTDSQVEFDKALNDLASFVNTNVPAQPDISGEPESDDKTLAIRPPKPAAGLSMDSPAEDASGGGSSMNEIGTKLDLARAYIDMGDPDGAKSILEEVVAEGNAQQKSEAQELLKHVS